MERINFSSLKLIEFLDNLNPKNSGVFFSIVFHLTILLFAVGLPNFFGPKDVFVPNIVPIEILNVQDVTNTEISNTEVEDNKNVLTKQKKFNSSENLEVTKQIDAKKEFQSINDKDQLDIKIKQKDNLKVEQKQTTQINQKETIQPKTKVETLKTNKIKPKLKPKPKNFENPKINSDVVIKPKDNEEIISEKKELISKPKPKPKEDFSIASMLKDLRNEESNNVVEEEKSEEVNQQSGENENKENMILSISEIDLLRQQLSSCWNAPAGAVIEPGMKVTISAKVQQNMKVYTNSVRIIDTNISKSNAYYGPITDSAMRTLLNPECTPLKLPKEKYDLWKNLTITFDYSIMKGY